MKFGVREITDIVFKATGAQTFGTTTYSQYDPVLFFESAKTSTLESSVATVYAQGGRGNPRLLAWDGDKVATFTFEDALISPISMSVLSGGTFSNATYNRGHLTEKAVMSGGKVKVDILYGTVVVAASGTIGTVTSGTATVTVADTSAISVGDIVYASGTPGILNGATVTSIPSSTTFTISGTLTAGAVTNIHTVAGTANLMKVDSVSGEIVGYATYSAITYTPASGSTLANIEFTVSGGASNGDTVLVDFYTIQSTKKIDISPEKFGGYYYVEANTLFRGIDGKDYPAQFTIPKAKVQSNFTFTMAPTGDPSTFNFVMDAFPAKTRFGTKSVLFALDISDTSSDVI